MYFEYGDAEICYLKKRDARLAEVIDSVGHIYREADTDLFNSPSYHWTADIGKSSGYNLEKDAGQAGERFRGKYCRSF